MKKTRRRFTNEFKLKVILDALKEQSSMKDLCQKYKLHATQITNWKQEFLDNAIVVLESKGSKPKSNKENKEKEKLYSKIGQLQMEIDFLKKKLS